MKVRMQIMDSVGRVYVIVKDFKNDRDLGAYIRILDMQGNDVLSVKEERRGTNGRKEV